MRKCRNCRQKPDDYILCYRCDKNIICKECSKYNRCIECDEIVCDSCLVTDEGFSDDTILCQTCCSTCYLCERNFDECLSICYECNSFICYKCFSEGTETCFACYVKNWEERTGIQLPELEHKNTLIKKQDKLINNQNILIALYKRSWLPTDMTDLIAEFYCGRNLFKY